MSAAASIDTIINRAIAVGNEKSDQADGYASAAMAAASGSASLSPQQVSFSPGSIEPPMNIPQNATGLDTALYGSTYDQVMQDLTEKFAQFFVDFFPNECDYLEQAQQWLCDTLAQGGTGVNQVVEDQLWQRDRDRIVLEGQRAEQQAVDGWASRGFPIPPGAAAFQVAQLQRDASTQIAVSSREKAIKTLDVEIENVRFAVNTAIDYRIKAIDAAGAYIRTLVIAPQVAADLATASAGAQAQLINAASSYYNARIRVEEIKLDVAKANSNLALSAGQISVDSFNQSNRVRASTAAALAQSLGQQASAALNAVNATAQIVESD